MLESFSSSGEVIQKTEDNKDSWEMLSLLDLCVVKKRRDINFRGWVGYEGAVDMCLDKLKVIWKTESSSLKKS